MDTYQPTARPDTDQVDAGQRMETTSLRTAARVAASNELLEEMAASLATVGLKIEDLTPAQRQHALSGFTVVRQIEDIPELAPGKVGEYIQAVNRAMLQGSVAAMTGKILLYGAQLYLAAVPQRDPGDDPLEIARTRAAVAQIDASSSDRRHRSTR